MDVIALDATLAILFYQDATLFAVMDFVVPAEAQCTIANACIELQQTPPVLAPSASRAVANLEPGKCLEACYTQAAGKGFKRQEFE